MPLIIFTFFLNTETQEAALAGNIPPQQALQVLQQIVIAEAIKQAKEEKEEKEEKE